MTTLLEVRIAALEAASRVYAEQGPCSISWPVLEMAQRFEKYLRTGENEG